MRYFVIGDDGQKYGPADVATLQTWVSEGRLLPTQQVEEEASGVRSAARAVNGLQFPMQVQQPGPVGPGGSVPQGSPYGQSAGGASNYPRSSESASGGDSGSSDVTLAWVFAVLGFLFCIFLHIPAIIFANKATEKGNPGGNAPRIFSFIVLGLQVVVIILYIILVVLAVKNGGGGARIGTNPSFQPR